MFGVSKAYNALFGIKTIRISHESSLRCKNLFATDVFLRLNGYQLKVDATKAHQFLIGLLEEDRCTFDQLLPWMRKHTVKK